MSLLRELGGILVVSCEVDLGVLVILLGGLLNSWIFMLILISSDRAKSAGLFGS